MYFTDHPWLGTDREAMRDLRPPLLAHRPEAEPLADRSLLRSSITRVSHLSCLLHADRLVDATGPTAALLAQTRARRAGAQC